MRRRAKRRISTGTKLLLVLTLMTLGLTAWIVPKLTDSVSSIRLDPERLLSSLGTSADTPAAGGATNSPRTGVEKPLPEDTQASAHTGMATPSPIRMLSLTVAGSVTVPKNVRQSGQNADGDTYSFDSIFAEVQSLIAGADLALCTVESAFTGENYADYNAPDAMLDALKFAGFDLLSLGNERALDKGIEGLRASITSMESRGFMVAGAVSHKEDLGSVRLLQVNEIQIAVLAYSYGVSNEGQKATAKQDRFATPLLDPNEIRSDIATARKAGADLVIVLPHWGSRNSTKVDPSQKTLAEQLVSMGADLVIGAHPNVVQPVEQVKGMGQDGKERSALVAYSLGSLLSDGRELVNAASMVMHFDFQVDTSAHTARLVRHGYAPIWVQRDRVSSGKYAYSVLRADDEDTAAEVDSATQRRLEDACITVRKALGEGTEVPIYWP